ncbi:MAG: VWA domain-containing protein [Planctomycetes bacterium]|nr:VWA domain-containing protein [Planctomycetota bacterium]
MILATLLQQAPAAGEGVRETLKLLDLPPAWVVVLLVVPGAVLLTWLCYSAEKLSLRSRAVLSGLRLFALLLLCLVLFRPVFVKKHEEIKPAEVLLLVDDSASMLRQDSYAGGGSRRGELERLAGKPPEGAKRLELARAGIEKELAPLLKQKGYELRSFRFGDTLEPVTDLKDLSGRGRTTQIGSALSQVLASHRGRNVSDIVIVSDGRSNAGTPPLEVARAAGAAGIRVHTVVVGDTRPEKNALVQIAEVPPSALEGDEIELSVRVAGRGLPAGTQASVVLEELDPNGDARPLAEEQVELDENGRRVVLLAPPLEGVARTNERRFRVRIPPLPEETLRDDNAVEFSVHVTPEKIRVLLVEGYPRWEYRYLKNLLLRSDQNLEVQCFLLSATPDFVQESTKGLPPLATVPTGRKDLLDHYDVVILGDVNPYKISPDPLRCEEFLNSLHEFVERGGGLICQAGEIDNPRAFLGTPLEELLPVVVDPTGVSSADLSGGEEFHGVLEDPSNPHEVVRLVPDAAENRALWETDNGLRGFTWFYPVLRAKPGAQVLLRHPSAHNAQGNYPLIVCGYFPAGRTLFMGVDSTFMWRFRFGDRFHERFWRNALRWVALGRLKSGDRRVQLDALRSRYNLDERVVIEGRVLDEDYRPSEAPTVDAHLSAPDGADSELKLTLVPDHPGLYRASLDVDRPGLYRVWTESKGVRTASADFEVVLPSRENSDPAPDPDLMARLAQASGGGAYELANLARIEERFPGQKERRELLSADLDDAWDHWGTLALALALLCTEWILRKRWELV